MASTSNESNVDLLSQIEVVVACNICDSTYSVPASIVRESQRLLAEGYCGESRFECDALYYAMLIEAEAIADLERAWARFQKSATSHGGMSIAVVGTGPSIGATDLDERGCQRWENEGGRCEHVRAAFAKRRAHAGADEIAPETPTDAGSARSS
jgi:hypothetical protein